MPLQLRQPKNCLPGSAFRAIPTIPCLLTFAHITLQTLLLVDFGQIRQLDQFDQAKSILVHPLTAQLPRLILRFLTDATLMLQVLLLTRLTTNATLQVRQHQHSDHLDPGYLLCATIPSTHHPPTPILATGAAPM